MTEHSEHKESHEHNPHHSGGKMKVSKTLIWQIVSLVLVIGLVASLYMLYTNKAGTGGQALTQTQAADKAVEFINNNLVQPGTKITLENITEENGLYKVSLSLQGNKIDSYITKDGKVFFPSAIDIKKMEEEKKTAESQQQQETKDMPKVDKPSVEVFVMSHCPFGTQIEKGIIPVAETLKDKIDFKIKFVDYAMHGEKEVTEELRQYCIQSEMPAQYLTYLKCFLKAGDSLSCITEVKIAETKLNACMSKVDAQYGLTASLNDPEKTGWRGSFPPFPIFEADNQKYGVQGSPHLVINGVTSNSGRDSASLLKAVCAGFNTAPSECSAQLSSASPSAGFGFAESDSPATAAACGTA